MMRSIITLLGFIATALALPATEINTIPTKTNSGTLATDSSLEGNLERSWPKHWEVATILYHYKCPVAGDDNRVIKIQVHFEGERSYFTGLQNAEKFGWGYYTPINSDSYKVTGDFNHGTCVHRPDGRKCGYSIFGSLSATTDEKNRRYHFDVPQSISSTSVAPTVIERCSAPGARDCPDIPGTTCEILAAMIAP